MRIDVHNHYMPADFIEEARAGKAIDNITIDTRDGVEWVSHPQGFQYPLHDAFWKLESKLANMDRYNIDVSVLSVSPTLLMHWADAAPTIEFCQRTNDTLAKFVAQSDRLYGMPMVPLQDPEAAAKELRRANTELGMKGVQIGTVLEDVPLDDPRFEPFFAEAEALNCPVTIHPYYVGDKPMFKDFYFTNLLGNPLETGLAASRMIMSGFLDRHPKLKVVLMHAGGFLPFQMGRLDHGYKVRTESNSHIDNFPSSYRRRFYYDTISHAPTPLAFLIEYMGADRVVIGTDIPFDMEDLFFEEYLGQLNLSEAEDAAINADNARNMYGI